MNLIYLTIYICLLSGIILLFYDPLVFLYKKSKAYRRLRYNSRSKNIYGKLSDNIEKTLRTVGIKNISGDGFCIFQTALGVVVFTSFLYLSGMVTSLFITSGFVLMPYLAMKMKVENMRKKGSYEGERLISEFLSQYRIANYNIYRTMELVITNGSNDIKVSKNLLYRILLEMRTEGNIEKIKDAAKIFTYGINTNWAGMFANNLAIAGESGINVQAALEDLLIQLREARKLLEERKRLNSEARRMLLFLIPLLYAGMFAASTRYLDIPFEKLFRNQFFTEEGIILFVICILLYLFNVVLIEAVRSKSFDF